MSGKSLPDQQTVRDDQTVRILVGIRFLTVNPRRLMKKHRCVLWRVEGSQVETESGRTQDNDPCTAARQCSFTRI